MNDLRSTIGGGNGERRSDDRPLNIRRAAVICPGPSGYDYTGGHDVVIGVNRAVLWTGCDYWACADAHTFGWVAKADGGPVGLPTIVCRTSIYREMVAKHAAARDFEHLNVRAITLPGSHIGWDRFSAHVAIVLAAQLGAERIDCYGMDLAGTADADGFSDGRQNRDEGRWAKERRLLVDLTEILRTRGVDVRRIPREDGNGRRIARVKEEVAR